MSQSQLKLLATNPHIFFREETKRERKVHFDVGKAVDIYTLDSIDELMDKVVLMEEQPNGMLYKIAEFLAENNLDPIDENILAAREQSNFFGNWKNQTVIDKFLTECLWYYKLLTTSNDDNIFLTKQGLRYALEIGDSLMKNPKTKFAFEPAEHVSTFTHVDIYFNHLGVDCKGELDKVSINFRDRTIQFYDVKTTGKSTRYFSQSVKDFRYDIQAACYTLALMYLIEGKATCPKLEHIDLSDFVILPPIFLVESTDPSLIGVCPMPYKASTEMLRAGRYGVYPDKRFTVTGPSDRTLFSVNYLMPGFDTLIEDYKWYLTRSPEDKTYTRIELEQMDSTGTIILNPW